MAGLSRRQRVGVVASAFGSLVEECGATISVFMTGIGFSTFTVLASGAYNAGGVGVYAATDACARDLITRWDAWPEGKHRLVGVLVVGVIPIVFGWIFAGLCIRVRRWVVHGAPS